MSVIDLKAQFGKRFKMGKDPAAGDSRRCEAQYQNILCKYGEIYVHGDEDLAVMVTSKRIAKKLRVMTDLCVTQVCKDVEVFKFPVTSFESVAKIIRARKKRQVTSQSMKNLGAKTAYKSRIDGTRR